jgi:hypothetical protein
MTNTPQTEPKVSSVDLDATAVSAKAAPQHRTADDWVWNYFLTLREEAELAAHAAGGSLPPDAFTYSRNAEELPTLRESVPTLREAEVSELQQILHQLDEAFTKFATGGGGYPSPHHSDNGDGPASVAA